MIAIVVGIAILVIGIIIIGILVGMYNGLIMLRNNIDKAWANIDVLLKQRTDELSKLLKTVKGFMKYEKNVLTELTKARTAILNANGPKAKAAANEQVSGLMKSIFAVAENYPTLGSNKNFIQFQQRISEVESQIADRREFYNDSVNTYNIKIQQIPYVFVAGSLGFTGKELFKVDEADKRDVEIDL